MVWQSFTFLLTEKTNQSPCMACIPIQLGLGCRRVRNAILARISEKELMAGISFWVDPPLAPCFLSILMTERHVSTAINEFERRALLPPGAVSGHRSGGTIPPIGIACCL